MSIQKILTIWEDPRLINHVASEVSCDDPRVAKIMEDLLDTFYAESVAGRGISGLAANEIGYDARIILLLSDTHARKNCEKIIIMNPVIKFRSGKMFAFWCGCRSVPGYRACVIADRHIKVSGRTIDGKKISRVFYERNAGVASHEMDHLNGKTIWTEKLRYTTKEYQDLRQTRGTGAKMPKLKGE